MCTRKILQNKFPFSRRKIIKILFDCDIQKVFKQGFRSPRQLLMKCQNSPWLPTHLSGEMRIQNMGYIFYFIPTIDKTFITCVKYSIIYSYSNSYLNKYNDFSCPLSKEFTFFCMDGKPLVLKRGQIFNVNLFCKHSSNIFCNY